ncbi:hypothetical protein LEP1GSC046_1503 [Leptospira kirschneri serovar Bim str. 1051]|nr:hypothetical protein LEP1GSC042_0888 [Leptospira kirschneri serovar Bim str. PUO 1247]EMN04871.1 hypothetical protein LEP1GSC046_1503 [Leptospira kirschneri serovar Bim str. 1051]
MQWLYQWRGKSASSKNNYSLKCFYRRKIKQRASEKLNSEKSLITTESMKL